MDTSARCTRHFSLPVALIGALAASVISPAQAAIETVETFGHWTVLRDTSATPPSCEIATRSADTLVRLDLQPFGNGGLTIFVSVTNGPTEPRATDDRVAVSWMPRQGEGQMHLATYPIAGSRLVPGPPARLFVHAVLRQADDVRTLLRDAGAAVGIFIALDPGYEAILPNAGFGDAWIALRKCDPLRAATLPAN